jgi:aminobenzoyl-glutamate utilization protein A
MLAGAAAMHGLTVDVELIGSVTTAVADAAATNRVAAAASAAGLRITGPAPDGGIASDDATALMRRVQAHGGRAVYTGIGADLGGPHHTSTFDIDEDALRLGTDLLERIVRG